MNVKQFARGTVVKVEAEIKRKPPFQTESYYDPSAGVKVTITHVESGDTAVSTTSMTKHDTGKYFYYWQTDSNDRYGQYKIEILADDTYDAVRREILVELV